MSTSDPALPPRWQFYADRARQTHDGRIDDFSYGREELLWESLRAIESDVPLTDDCKLRLDRIPHNRAKKHRRLRLHPSCRRTPFADHSGFETVDRADLLAWVRLRLSPTEWEIERRLAYGQTYCQVAIDYGLSSAALKVRTARWRARVRRELAA
jgi:hypothetical protein